jgi:hypothetical protein
VESSATTQPQKNGSREMFGPPTGATMPKSAMWARIALVTAS